MEINKDFVSYEIARKLFELGFNEPCLKYYTYTTERLSRPLDDNLVKLEDLYMDNILAPTWLDVILWLVKEYDLYLQILPALMRDGTWYWEVRYIKNVYLSLDDNFTYDYITALNIGILETLKICKKK